MNSTNSYLAFVADRVAPDPARNPCEDVNLRLLVAGQMAFLPVWELSRLNAAPFASDEDEVRGFLTGYRRAVSDDPNLLPVSPQDAGRLLAAEDRAVADWAMAREDYERSRDEDFAARRQLMADEFLDERAHPVAENSNA
jgi:hypothetical protein